MSDTAIQLPSSQEPGDQLVEHLTNQQVEEITQQGGYLNFLNRKPGYQLVSFRRPAGTDPLAINVITYAKHLV